MRVFLAAFRRNQADTTFLFPLAFTRSDRPDELRHLVSSAPQFCFFYCRGFFFFFTGTSICYAGYSPFLIGVRNKTN